MCHCEASIDPLGFANIVMSIDHYRNIYIYMCVCVSVVMPWDVYFTRSATNVTITNGVDNQTVKLLVLLNQRYRR